MVTPSVVSMELLLDDLDNPALLAASSEATRARRLAEVLELRVLSQWAAAHSEDPTEGPDGDFQRRRGNVLRPVGGEGTPEVQDFCLGEFALSRGTGVTATINALADVLDLQHRLPNLWSVVRSGDAEAWIARRVARLARHLPLADVWVVDVAVAAIIAREAAGRVIAVAEAKIIEANPEVHDAKVEAERQKRYVRYGRRDELGLQTVIARIEAGDAQWIRATIERVVEIITPQHEGTCADEVRAIAFGYLARPAELLALLLENLDEEPSADGDPGGRARRGHEDTGEEAADSEPGGRARRDLTTAHLNRAIAFPADLLNALRAAGLAKLAPRAVLYIHLHEASLLSMDGVTRVEGLGAHSMAQLRLLLAGRDVVVKPVIDLAERVRSTAYEHPESLKERVHLLTGGDYWPFATSTSRHVDYDHPIPYNPHGPPGQTSIHNSGPLGRRHHRWKTHAGFRARQSGLGRYAWLTPNGLGFIVDYDGTRQVTAEEARMVIEAPAGVEIYPG